LEPTKEPKNKAFGPAVAALVLVIILILAVLAAAAFLWWRHKELEKDSSDEPGMSKA
jgi:hypothetical protein